MADKVQEESDELLMDRVQANDLEAFEILTGRYKPRLYSFIYRHVRNKETSEDLVQETLLKVYKHRLLFKKGARLSTWVFTMALNLCRDQFRNLRPMSSLSDLAVLAVAEKSRFLKKEPDPESLAEQSELSALLVEALATLPGETQELLRLHGQEDLTFKEAGKKIGISQTSARSSASRAYKKLRERLVRLMKPSA